MQLSTPFASRPALRAAAWAAATTLLAASAFAGEPISTDRPDFVESSDVVGDGHVQIETGLQFERQSGSGPTSRVRTTPTLLRFGVSDRLELRVETDGDATSRSTDPATGLTQRAHGFSDVALGAKWHAQDGDEAIGKPAVAWLLHLDVDSGSRAFRGQGLRPSLRAVAEWELPEEMSVGVMPGVMFDRDADGHRFASAIFAVTASKALTSRWHAFLEVAGQQLASRRHGGSVVTLDTGVAWLVTDDLQLDLAVSRGLTSESPDLQWGVGLSVRY